MRARRTSAPDRRDGKSRRRAAGLLPHRKRPAAGRDPAAEPSEAAEPRDLLDERRLRDSGAPEDVATYTCVCGFIWEAPVTASVACPHCGTPQAW